MKDDSKPDNEQIGAQFFPPDRLLKADVAIVLGANDPVRPAERAAALYHGGHARTLLFTGGFNAKLQATEAEAMAAIARESGVPDEVILIEPKATHTDENLAFARALIGMPPSLLLVTIQFHLRRALIATRKHFPETGKVGWSCYPSRHYTAEDWQLSDRGQADVASELRKIALYYGIAPGDGA